MREPVILSWCDECWADGQQRVSATNEFAAGVVEGGDKRPLIKRLDLCEVHAKTALSLMALLEHAVPLAAAKVVEAEFKPKTEATVYSHLSPSQRPVDCPVFNCNLTLSGRNSLVGHIWTQHRFESRPIGPTICPDCDYTGRSAEVGQHRVKRHGYDQIAEALQGLQVVRYRG